MRGRLIGVFIGTQAELDLLVLQHVLYLGVCACICVFIIHVSVMYDVIHTSLARTMFPGKGCSAHVTNNVFKRNEKQSMLFESTPRSIALISVYRHGAQSDFWCQCGAWWSFILLLARYILRWFPAFFVVHAIAVFAALLTAKIVRTKIAHSSVCPFASYAIMSLTIVC